MIKELLQKAELLVALLKDPHPGLSTWQDAVAKLRKEIGND